MTTEHHHSSKRVEGAEASTYEALTETAQHPSQLRARTVSAILERAARLRDRIIEPTTFANAGSSLTEKIRNYKLGLGQTGHAEATEVAAAWEDLREHPALQWVPPVWRTSGAPVSAQTAHMVRAMDRNLVVTVLPRDHGMCVRLATGPLVDRELDGRVDPTSPAKSIDPSLDVVAESFDQAVLELRKAVISKYGPIPEEDTPRAVGFRDRPQLFAAEEAGSTVRRFKQKR